MQRFCLVRTLGCGSYTGFLVAAVLANIITCDVRADVVTFAQFIQQSVSQQDFVYANNGPNATFGSASAGIPIFLLVTDGFAPSLPQVEPAHLFLTSSTTTSTLLPVPPDQFMRQHFPAAANMLQVVLDKPVDGKTNFLTVSFSDGFLSGRLGSTLASLKASDADSANPSKVSFSSDFIDFSGATEHGLSLSFSSVVSMDGTGNLQLADNGFFKSFTSSGTGTFDFAAPVPEPSGLFLAAFGLLGVLGLAWQRRRRS
jgi:hypothetical protein